jgi:hypothetical protein
MSHCQKAPAYEFSTQHGKLLNLASNMCVVNLKQVPVSAKEEGFYVKQR